jgi:4'-phosphopantetheinyl transferase EntD
MEPRINLADPSFEPTDEQLEGLSKRAFAGVREAHERAMARMRAEIAAGRMAAMERLHARKGKANGP